MIIFRSNGVWRVTATFPTAEAVYLLGEFNGWSTTATPMRSASDGGWELELPKQAKPDSVAFFFWLPGQNKGQVCRGEPVAA